MGKRQRGRRRVRINDEDYVVGEGSIHFLRDSFRYEFDA